VRAPLVLHSIAGFAPLSGKWLEDLDAARKILRFDPFSDRFYQSKIDGDLKFPNVSRPVVSDQRV
jgi:hypothetical protein